MKAQKPLLCPSTCCPGCGCPDLKVLETRTMPKFLRRRKYCTSCHKRFTTREVLVPDAAARRKTAGTTPVVNCKTCAYWTETTCGFSFPEATRSAGRFATDCSLYEVA
ncbi:MAG: hypothetical protein ACO28M_08345 [Vulcanococcus sp.]